VKKTARAVWRGREFFFMPLVLLVLALLIFPAGLIKKANLETEDYQNETVAGEVGKKLDLYLTRITPFGFSGALLAAKEGTILLNKGYGLAVRSQSVPNTSQTVFSTGSISKQFTAAAIMKLETMGKLHTEDSISKYFLDVPDDKKGITLHHLLTHTSGVIDALGGDYEKALRDETMKKILDAPLQFEPGERFSYSNLGYSMLAAVIEKVSGETYEEFLNQFLFKPAGMAFTGYRKPDWSSKVVAHWYVGDKDNGIPLEKPYPYWNLLGNGGILSTTEDMYRWHQALLGDKVLPDEAKKKMFTPFLNDYGYGWDVFDTGKGVLIQHDGGSMLGNSAEIRRYIDQEVATILFCNQSYGRQTLMEAVRDKIEMLVFGGKVPMPPPVLTPDPKQLTKFEGTFELPSGGHLEVKQEGQKLIVNTQGQDAACMLFDPENPDPSEFVALNRLSESVFHAVFKDDFKPLEDVLHEKERRADPVRELIQMRLKMHKKRTGKIIQVTARGTLPATFDGQKAAKTTVELRGERGSLFFALYWKDGKNVGVGPSMPPGPMSVPLLPLSDLEFAGYRLDTAANIRLLFLKDETGTITGLAIPGKKDLFASRIKK
jgi:CubicO group peptidase (beta-lactamase class C family)